MVKKRITDNELNKMFNQNVVPDNFYQLEYDKFLQKRRKLLAEVIGKAFTKI